MYYFLDNFLVIIHSYVTDINFLNILLNKLNHLKLNLIIIVLIFINFYYRIKIIFYFNLLLIQKIINYSTNNFILYNFYLGYYKNHPILLYCSIALLITMNKNNIILKLTKFRLIITLILTFLLGSLWALTQFIWGRYWSYDTIEFILILFIVFFVYYLHRLKIILDKLKMFSLCQIFLLIISLRLNLIYTKHNFFQKTKLTHLINLWIFIFIVNLTLLIKFQKKFILKIMLWLYLLNFIIFHLFWNVSNHTYTQWTVIWGFLYYFFYLCLLVKDIKRRLTTHIVFFCSLLIFSNYYINFLQNHVYINIKKHIQSTYFIFKKNTFNYFFIKNSKKISFKQKFNYIDIKLYTNYSKRFKINNNLINYF